MWAGTQTRERGEDTGWGEHFKSSDIINNHSKEPSEDAIGLDIQDYGQHHRKDESTGDIYFQHSDGSVQSQE
jgi:hypothetical protein